jgi:DNA modification methylase
LKPYEVLHADCIAAMSLVIEPGSVDAIVTDPPYELGFMGKGWDSTGIANNPAVWRAAFDCLKPGGHLLAFSGTRTYHRMVCAIEDAGFEIRDQIGWAYGSGFPKSLDVSKAIDKAAGAERPVIREVSDRRDDGTVYAVGHSGAITSGEPITAAAAAAWQGWGTALKPAWEPIVVARKPLIGTVAANVLAHGTGALNIDGCRVGSEGGTKGVNYAKTGLFGKADIEQLDAGRWPANLIHDGSDEVLAAFPQAKGQQGAVTGDEPSSKTNAVYGAFNGRPASSPRGDTGSAARFFYCAKASKSDRNEGLDAFTPATTSDGRAKAADNAYQRGKTERANTHPTVKPTELMRYLCRLITPPGGLVLDPFTGSGSTGKAAVLEGFRFVGCELSDEYVRIAEARIAHAWTSTLRSAA